MDDEGKCGLCRRGWNGFDAAYSFGSYQDELRTLIHLFKYSRIPTLAVPLGRFLSSVLPRSQGFDLIVPVPMHWLRQWQRGFNQAELLAREVGRRTHVPVRLALARVHHRAVQAGLTGSKRRANVTGAFAVKRPRDLAGKRVLLIDDVMTTGSTASTCALEMKRAGASHITLLTVARVDRRIAAIENKSSNQPFRELSTSGSFEHAKFGSFA